MHEWTSELAQARPGHLTALWLFGLLDMDGLGCNAIDHCLQRSGPPTNILVSWAESGFTPTPETEPIVFRPEDQLLEATKGPT